MRRAKTLCRPPLTAPSARAAGGSHRPTLPIRRRPCARGAGARPTRQTLAHLVAAAAPAEQPRVCRPADGRGARAGGGGGGRRGNEHHRGETLYCSVAADGAGERWAARFGAPRLAMTAHLSPPSFAIPGPPPALSNPLSSTLPPSQPATGRHPHSRPPPVALQLPPPRPRPPPTLTSSRARREPPPRAWRRCHPAVTPRPRRR